MVLSDGKIGLGILDLGGIGAWMGMVSIWEIFECYVLVEVMSSHAGSFLTFRFTLRAILRSRGFGRDEIGSLFELG